MNFILQSQPCHWRNLKGVTKREAPSEPINSTLSDNISLFQSIRVLQDEEEPSIREEALSKLIDINHKKIEKLIKI